MCQAISSVITGQIQSQTKKQAGGRGGEGGKKEKAAHYDEHCGGFAMIMPSAEKRG